MDEEFDEAMKNLYEIENELNKEMDEAGIWDTYYEWLEKEDDKRYKEMESIDE